MALVVRLETVTTTSFSFRGMALFPGYHPGIRSGVIRRSPARGMPGASSEISLRSSWAVVTNASVSV